MPSLKEEKEGLTRGDFLKTVGVGLAALGGACDWRWPHEKSIPKLERQEGEIPGVARWYASTCSGCEAACGVLVKTLDGRPIKLEGLPEHPLSAGGLCARGQASLLNLYDSGRLRAPMERGQAVSWEKWDQGVVQKLKELKSRGAPVRLVTRTIVSPSLKAAVEGFLAEHPNARHVSYDPISSAAILEAHQKTHGRRVLPHYLFAQADAIASFDADFLGTWISPVEFAKDWVKNRVPSADNPTMSWHAQFEPRVSLTGANADLRVPVKPSEEYGVAAALAERLAGKLGVSGPRVSRAAASVSDDVLDKTAEALAKSKRKSLVVSGSTDVAVQILVNWMNAALGNYGKTLDIRRPSLVRQGDDQAFGEFARDLIAGKIAGAVFVDANPAYEHPLGAEIAAALAKMELSVAVSERPDETASRCVFTAPLSHTLESWGDASPVPGLVSVIQPAMKPLFESRPALETVLALAEKPERAYDYIRSYWKTHVFPRQKSRGSFEDFWGASVEAGFASYEEAAPSSPGFSESSLASARPSRRAASAGEFELVAYPTINLYDGRHAFNPWLNEFPDPVTRASWGNYVQFSPKDAERLKIAEGRMVRLGAGGRALELPAQIQPGMPRGVVAVALGYGRAKAKDIAANYPITKIKFFPIEQDDLDSESAYPLLGSLAVSISPLDRVSPLAKIQRYDFQTDPYLNHDRNVLREQSLADFVKTAASGGPDLSSDNGLWPDVHKYPGRKWAMSVDLNRCIGCAACVVACQSENNTPTVGKAEMRKSRDLYWLRIDRYYSGSPKDPEQDPAIAFQPMTCQQCDNAPCETVCPVEATAHSSEGLNMQTYNRCVGTRYCENNCPYKVRRFNWFDYNRDDKVQDLVLNPDVTVRQRGVMEKCNFCYQRIRNVEITAQIENRPVKDGEIQPACVQSCPTKALVFGDINDVESNVTSEAASSRVYRALEELGVKPSIYYQTKVRNS